MKKVVWTGLLIVVTLGLSGGPVAAQSSAGARHQMRVERQERNRERTAQRREQRLQRLGDERYRRSEQRRMTRLDRNGDGFISRGEASRYRAAVRRAIRQAYR